MARSRVSNGAELLPGVDGRSAWARRCRDLIEIHLADLGGKQNTSEAERSLIRRAAVLECELERLEVAFATSGAASDDALDLYQRTSGGLRRLLETLGLKRRPRTIVPSVEAYIAATANEPEPEEVVE